MMFTEGLVNKADLAIVEVVCDTTVDVKNTIKNLEYLRDKIDIYLENLCKDIREEDCD